MTNQNLIAKETLQELMQTQSTFAEQKKKEALAIFNSIPMPKEKQEDWRYTNIEKLGIADFDFSHSKTEISASALSNDLIEKGVILTDINTGLEKHPEISRKYMESSGNDKFSELNASFFCHGFFLYIPKNVEINEPVKVDFSAADKSSVVLNIIVAEPNSRVEVIEKYSNKGDVDQINSSNTTIFANPNSKVNFCHINSWGDKMNNFAQIQGTLGRNAQVNFVSGSFGGKLNRLKIDTVFEGEGSECNNIGIFMGKGKEHIDMTTNMFHNAKNTKNYVMVDGILKDSSTSVYRGLIRIPKEGQKTNSYLENHILKLGDKTLANSIPSLKIDANDVKASHGATVGQIDEEHLFYLMARGLSRQESEKLIVEGFFEPVIQKIPSEELRQKIRELVRK